MPPSPTIFDFFQPEWVQGALGFGFFGIVVVIGVFAYLNRYTERNFFRLWTLAWLFFAVFLAASSRLVDWPDDELLNTVRTAAVGVSALFMFWGSFQLNGYDRPARELISGTVLMVLWSYLAVYKVHEALWFNLPVFLLLAGASGYTGLLYHRNPTRLRASAILSSGFFGWGGFLLVFPLLSRWSDAAAVGYLFSGVLALYLALGMVVQVLNEERERHESLLGELNRGVARSRLLEHEISVTEQKYRELFDSASDAFFLVDLETLQVTEANQAAERLVSPLADRLVGRGFLDICPDVRPEGPTLLAHKKGFEDVLKPFATVRVIRPDRSAVVCEGEARLIECNKRPVMQVNMREITERQRLERELRQAEKLSALGQLVAGVAHELNNPLAVISGYTQLLAKRPDVDQRMKQELQRILHEGDRAAKIVRNLLTFARPHDPEMRVVQLNDLVRSVLENHAGELVAHNVRLETELADHLPLTKADPNQIEQVLTNLVSNAIHAQADQETPAVLQVTTEHRDALLRIVVADAGPGIAPENIDKIFEPFYTTKAPGQGTGLGLAISHAIVEEHHGKIAVQSELGQGARFIIELPWHRCPDLEPSAPTAAARAAPAPAPAGHGHRLLLVDDEPGIIDVLKEVLVDGGYEVDTANNGITALELLAAGTYDVIVSDLRMPDMDGERLYHEVRERDADLARRIIFLTGDTVSGNARGFLESTRNRWFSKPFNIGEIEEVIANFVAEQPAFSVSAR